jgi:hypothetical protein
MSVCKSRKEKSEDMQVLVIQYNEDTQFLVIQYNGDVNLRYCDGFSGLSSRIWRVPMP